MLADWYFCCCIDATPDKMVAFLSTLETLANPESDSVLLQIALAELDRADSWMQWYAVPQILNITHHPSANDSVRQAVHYCLGETLRKLPREIIPEYEEVLELCLNRSSPSDLLSKLSKLMTDLAIRPLHEGLKPSDQPYLDLHEFAPQNVLLAIMCDCLCPTSGATADIRTYLNSRRGDGALNDLLDQALDGRLGRLALRLAATITRRAFSKPEALSNLANRVLSIPQANLAFEPDLMRTLAEILFEGRPATELLNETVDLVNLPPLLEHIQPLSTLGLDVPKDRRQALEISLWQATLWDLAAESDPEGIAESIIDKWWMRDTSRPLPPQLFVSAANNDFSGWLTRLKSFWHAIALETEPPLPLQVGRGSYRPPSPLILRLLSSPLLPIQTMSFMSRRPLDGLGRYPTADRPVAQLRLWSGAVTAVRLLQKIPEDHPARPMLAQVIAQTADSLNLLYGTTPGNDWLKNYDKPDIFYKIKKERRLTFPLTGLALFINRQVNLAVRGKLPSIAPRLFVDLLHENWLPENFRRYALPPLLMRWIGDAYLGAIPERPTSRWLDLIDEVNDSFDYVFYRDRPNTVSVTEWAALVVRFLCRNAWDPGAISHLDWRNACEVKRSYKPPLEVPAQWHVSARRLLLTRELTPNDWLPPWEEPTLDPGRRLVRALERLASLQRGQATGSEVTAKWRKDFLDGINGILKHADLDRFARLRLVEFVDDPVLADDADGQELIGLALLEHGSPYELYGLLRRLYMGSVNASSARRQVQERLIPAILQTAVENLTEQKVLLNPRDPRLARDELDKAEMLQDFVLLLAHQGATTSHPEWLRHLAEWQETRRTAQADSSLRRRQVDVEILNARKRLLLERGEVPAWAIHAISYDPNQLVAALFYHDLDIPPDTTVLFGRREREIREFLSGPFDALSYVLAVVANATQEPDRSQYPYRYRFNIGAWFPLNFGYKHEQGWLREGDPVLLPLERKPNDVTPRVATQLPIQRVRRRWQPGDLARLTLREDNRKKIMLMLNSEEPTDLWPEVDPDIWDPDISRSYQERSTLLIKSVLAERADNGRWQPLDRDMVNWLADWPTNEQIVIGVYVEPATTASGQVGWRFSVQPGQNYVLLARQLPPADAEELAVAVQDSQTGLLVAFELNRNPDCPGIRLARSVSIPTELTAYRRYPDLQLPFDRRNLDWAALFTDNSEHIAERVEKSSQWILLLGDPPIPGFPRSLEVKWGDERPPFNRTHAELSNIQWYPRDGVVVADWVQAFEAHPHNGDWTDFCVRWLSPREGMPLTLRRIQGKLTEGFIVCFTDEDIYVQVEPESLTMLPWRGPLRLTEGRAAEICRVNRLSQSATRLDTDDLDDFSVLRSQITLRGIVTSVPRTEEVGTLCQIVWESEPARPIGLHIKNLGTAHLRPGMIVIASKQGGHWSLETRRRGVFARALWRLEETILPDRALTFLGLVSVEHKLRTLAQIEPGQLGWMPGQLVRLNHLAKRKGESFSGGESFGRPIKARQNKKFSRVALSLADGEIFGYSPNRFSEESADLYVNSVRVYLNFSEEQPRYCWLRRSFDLRLAPASLDNPNQHWLQLLEKYFARPEPLPVTSDGRIITLRNLRVPTDDAGTNWVPQVTVAPGEGAYMENVEYSQDAQVVLFEDADRHIWASFRKVPAYSPERFHEVVIGGGFGHEPHKLAVPLYYVGPELSDPTPAVSERMHRFEWMRGFALLVPENQLLFHGQPFPHAELVLTYGDIVTALKVLPGDTLSAAIDPDLVSEDLDGYPSEGRRRSVFDIYEHFIQFSIGRTLYGQRKANIVHVLSLAGSGSDLRINRIQGFESVPEISERLFGEDMREFQPVANLDKASLERLKTRWPDRPGNPTDHFILGRLDVEAFEETVGKSLVYKHVRLTFQPDVGGSPLNNGELIFMRAGRLVERANDIFLEVRPLARLDPADIGPDFMAPCRLKRRAFSVREDLLYRILGDLGADYLKNMEVLVRLLIDGDRIGVSLQHGLNRLERALQRAIQASGGGLLFASVLSESSGGTLRVELKPGLFVQLPYSGPEQLQKGDVVAIQHVCGVYRVAPVAPAQSRYLESGPRPAVALPMDSLFSNSLGQRFALDENKTWLKKPFCFALGGLASVVAQPGSYNTIREEWTPPVADDFIRLMRTSPPHIVTTGLDHFGRPRIAVQSLPGWVAGRLELIESSLDVLGRTFDGGNLPNEARLLDWLTLTFGDESVRDVVGRTRQGTWKYHDRLTGYWKSTEGALINSRQSTQAMSAFDGPVFFQGKEWRLRYTPDNFLRAGFPVQELVDSLRCSWMSKPRRYPVAGPSEAGGLWIELTPGRLAELPGAMLFFRSRGQDWSLARLQWQAFAAGDFVELDLSATGAFTPDRINLVCWQPGPRQALGPGRCFLPIAKRDEERGAVLLGAGGYCLTLPVAKPDPLWVTMILDVTNTLSDASNAIPSCGDVVLLGVDDTGDVLCLGMRGYKPSPDRRDTLWATDPLAGECLSNRRLSALIQAAGGALPVTVESFNEASSRLMFSRRLQLWPCGSQGGLTMGRVVGLLGHNGDRALIRTGGALLKVAVNDLVAGLPADREIQKAAAEVLRDAGFPIWLEVDAAGRVTGSGLPEADPQLTPEFAVKPFGAVGGNKGGGVLCQALHSEKLFWLSDRQLAWTQLSINQLRQHVVNRPQLWVRRQSHIGASDSISVVRADRATQELARLQVGREMLVKVIDKLAGAARTQGIYLVESFSSGVMLTCETQEELELGQHKPVEVVRRSSGSMQAVVTAPKDEQPQSLDLPRWMLASWPESRREEWTAFVARYSQPFNPEQITTEEVIAAVPSVLNEYLASADRWRSSNTDVIELQSRIALRWKRAFLEDVGQPEMEVGPALLAVLLLDRVGEVMVESANPDQSDLGRNYSRHAVTLLMELGLRARRSLHSEVFSRALLGASLLRRRSDQLGQRLHDLESRLSKPLKVEDVEAVRSFCRAVSTRQAADFLPLASGLAAALGDLRDWRILWDKAPVCKRLIEMSRTLPAQKARLNKAIRDELRRMVDEILAQDLDIVLLDPIFLEGSDTA